MKISISPTALLFLVVLTLKGHWLLPASLLAALVHECGHLLAARTLGVRMRRMEIDLFGAKLTPVGLLPTYKAELLIAAAGPLFSLLLGIFLIPHHGAFAICVRDATLSFALFNLLPIRDFDGGRMLHACLAPHVRLQAADRCLTLTSYLCLLFLFLFSSCLLLRYGQSPTLTVLCASLFAKLFLTKG